MKTKIRKSAFDCNSSSMHSLVVKKENSYYTEEEVKKDVYLGKDGLLDPWDRNLEFGRSPFQVLCTLKEKAYYTLASMCKYKGDDVYNEICDVIRSYIPEFVDIELSFKTEDHHKKYYTEDEMKQYFGEGNFIDQGEYWITWGYKTGYVDEDILTGFLKKENITITEFLKNKRYIVIVDGDEYCIYKDMKRCGLINANNIEYEYPDYDDMYNELRNTTINNKGE